MAVLEPGLAPGLTGCRVRIGFPVPPSSATHAFAGLAERRGVRLRIGDEAAGLVRTGDASPASVSPTARRSRPVPSSWRPGRRRPVCSTQRPMAADPADVGRGRRGRAQRATSACARRGRDGGSHRGAGRSRGRGRRWTPCRSRAGSRPDDGPDSAGDRPEFSLVTAGGRSSLGSTFLDHEPEPGAGSHDSSPGAAGSSRRSRPRAARRRAVVCAAGVDRRPTAHRRGARPGRSVRRGRPRPVGDLDRAGFGAAGGRRDPGRRTGSGGARRRAVRSIA